MIKYLTYKNSAFQKVLLFLFTYFFLFIQVIGYNCSNYDSAKLTSINTYLFIIFVPIFYYLFKVVFNYSNNHEFRVFKSNKKVFLYSFILILVAWIPILISFYPNNFSYDGGTQVRMIMFNVISKYHPVIHTVFLGGLVKYSYLLFGTYDIGNFIYALIQSIFMCSVFSYLLCFLNKEKAPKFLIIYSLIAFMFLPINSVLAITTTKDVIFSGLILLLVIRMYYISFNKDYLSNKRNLISTIIILFLTLIFRNNMLYAVIIMIIPVFIILRNQIKNILILIFCSLALFSIYDKTLTYGFGVEHGPRVEAFSVIIQQLARVYNVDDLNDNEKELVSSLYKNDSLNSYNSQLADPVKSNFDADVLLKDKSKYLKLYIDLGLKYPFTYIDSILDNTYGYFYFFDKLPISSTKTYIEISCMSNDFYRVKTCNNNYIYNLYNDLLDGANYQKIPIVNLLMNIGFNVFILFFVFFLAIFKKKYNYIIPLLVLMSLFITNMLGPVALVRYIYPIIVCIPYLLFTCFKLYRNY